ncbi:MAG: septum formation family protein [Actinomycetota bacterium]|nr:septum formation family protein [Actinomycetota bacterium]
MRIGLLVVAVVLGSCGPATEDPTPTADSSGSASIEPSAPASGPPTPSTGTGAGEETSVFELEAGDCFSVESDELTTVAVVDCEQSHEYEAFALLDHEAGEADPYPGDDAMLEYGDTACQAPFGEYVGREYQASVWYITSLYPSEQTWADGDRELVCTLYQRDADSEPIAVTGSAEGSGD